MLKHVHLWSSIKPCTTRWDCSLSNTADTIGIIWSVLSKEVSLLRRLPLNRVFCWTRNTYTVQAFYLSWHLSKMKQNATTAFVELAFPTMHIRMPIGRHHAGKAVFRYVYQNDKKPNLIAINMTLLAVGNMLCNQITTINPCCYYKLVYSNKLTRFFKYSCTSELFTEQRIQELTSVNAPYVNNINGPQS